MRAILLLSIVILIGTHIPATAADETPSAWVVNGDFETAAHQARPAVCQVFGAGYTNVFDPGNAFGLPWIAGVAPCHSGVFKAAQWSTGTTTDVGDFDGDGDREAKFIADPAFCDPNVGCNHNMWQAYPNPQQAYTMNVEAIEITVEAGTVPSVASLVFSLSTTPLNEANPYVGLFFECDLRFTDQVRGATAGETISIDPTTGTFTSRYNGDGVTGDGCADLVAAWNAAAAGSDERRDILDQLRIVQHSYWNWNKGTEDVIIDDITGVHARTVAEALLD